MGSIRAVGWGHLNVPSLAVAATRR